MNNIYVDIHVLQTLPPNCVNRDDTGAPKTAVYGGVTRARVSSQAWKKAVRDQFKEALDPDAQGIRTKKIVALVKAEILKLKPKMAEDEAEEVARAAIECVGITLKKTKLSKEEAAQNNKKEEYEMDSMWLVSHQQAAAVAKIAVNHAESLLKKQKTSQKTSEEKKNEKSEGNISESLAKALKKYPSVDMLLFGRMLAKDKSFSYDACVQVAHAISTHAVQNEFDYFTVVDELKNDSSGAGYLGSAEFSSSTLYRYATVNFSQLASTVEKHNDRIVDPSEIVVQFLKAFIRSIPSGKQNTFANNTLPGTVYITVRTDQPVSLVTAFEKAIPASKDGYEERSRKALGNKAKQIYDMLGKAPDLEILCGEEIEGFEETVSLPEAYSRIEAKLNELLKTDGEE